MNIGSNYFEKNKSEFIVWAPLLKDVSLKIVSENNRIIPMTRDENGYWRTLVENIKPDAKYLYRLNHDRDRPDPASHFQPDGVHTPSQVINHNSFKWDDKDFIGLHYSQMIMYELHVGTFTEEGTFEAIISRLSDLTDLGVNAIEIMPISQFPGNRNWGYDGVYPFAIQNSYGGPNGLKRLVNECHKMGISVILDVVYNHLGPEGNYIWDFAPYFTEKYKTPWGWAVNFDDAYSNDVRNYFIENALYWFKNYHFDALRLDAIHGITDFSAHLFLEELAEKVKEYSKSAGRDLFLIAESDLNDSRVIKPKEINGYGLNAQWCDDFHHIIHTLLTGESFGYYEDFNNISQLAKSLKEGYVYTGQYSSYRKRNHGNSSKDLPCEQFIVFSQNHDHIGNRMSGERLSTLVDFDSLKLAAGIVILSPFVPLLFMGEEYGEESPFLYFISHSDKALIEAVRKGRSEYFLSLNQKGDVPDPYSEKTFLKSKLSWKSREQGRGKILLGFYKHLISLRKNIRALANLSKENLDVSLFEHDKTLAMKRRDDNSALFLLFNFGDSEIESPMRSDSYIWNKIFDSSDKLWGGDGSIAPDKIVNDSNLMVKKRAFVVYEKEMEA